MKLRDTSIILCNYLLHGGVLCEVFHKDKMRVVQQNSNAAINNKWLNSKP